MRPYLSHFFISVIGEIIINFLSNQLLFFNNFSVKKETINTSCFLHVAKYGDPTSAVNFLQYLPKDKKNS